MSPFTYYNIVPIIVPSPLHKAICYSYVFSCLQVLTGFLMNIISILIVALCLNTYGVKIFDIQSELPHWANTTSCTA